MVFNILGYEIQGFSGADVDLTIIDNALEWRHPGKLPRRPSTEVRSERRGRGDETPADIDHRVWAENKSVRVGKDHGAVRVETSENLRRVGVSNLVDDDRIYRRLKERRRLAGLDVETAPVQKRHRAGGGDVELRTVLLRGAGLTADDGHARRVGEQKVIRAENQRGHEPVFFGLKFHGAFRIEPQR